MSDGFVHVENKTICELKETMGEDFDELVEIFIKDLNTNIKKLEHMINENNLPIVKNIAHSIKGSSINMGATQLSLLCKEIEDSLSAQQPISLIEYLQHVKKEVAYVAQIYKNLD